MSRHTSLFLIVLFILVFTSKDLLTKYLFMNELTIFEILFFMGAGCLSVASLEVMIKKEPILPKNARYQFFRLFVTGGAWFFATLSFKYLNAGTISIISKVNTPLMIIVASFIGVFYSKKQIRLSYLTVVLFFVFAIWNRNPNDHFLGYIFFSIALVFVIIEYIMLKDSTQKENMYIVAATPSISCFLIGLLGVCFQESAFQALTSFTGFLVFLNGIVMYLFYRLSIYRYRILPLGLSELPALLASYVIIFGERTLFGVQHSVGYILFLVLVTVLLLYIFTLRKEQGFLDKEIVS